MSNLMEYLMHKERVETLFNSLTEELVMDTGIGEIAVFWEQFKDKVDESILKKLFMMDCILMLMDRNELYRQYLFTDLYLN